jgi:hypothetical protein
MDMPVRETVIPVKNGRRVSCKKCGNHAGWRVARQTETWYESFYACNPEHF